MKSVLLRTILITEENSIEACYRTDMNDSFTYDFAHKAECVELVNAFFEELPKVITHVKATHIGNEYVVIEDEKETFKGQIVKQMFNCSIPVVSADEYLKLAEGKVKKVCYYDNKNIGAIVDEDYTNNDLINKMEGKKMEEKVIDVQFEEAAKNGKESAEVINKETAPKVSRSLYSKVKGSKAMVGLGSIIGQIQIIAWTCSDKEKEGYNALLAKLIKAREDLNNAKNDEETGKFKKVVCTICKGFLLAMEVILGVLQFGVDVITITIKWAWNIGKAVVTETVKSGCQVVDAFDKDVIDIFKK